jgi:hypothetical protein
VYVEARRRSWLASKIQNLLDDLATLCEFQPQDWQMTYEDQEFDWSPETFNAVVPTSPRQYRERKQLDLNEMRIAAGLEPRRLHVPDQVLKQLQSAAGI